MKSITEKTLIPISLVIVIVTTTVWITIVAQDVKANTSINAKQDQDIEFLKKEVVNTQKKMIESLTRIETKLEIKRK